MTEEGCEFVDDDIKSGYLPSKVVDYEQFLNDTLRGDLKYANLLRADCFSEFVRGALVFSGHERWLYAMADPSVCRL